MISGTAKKLSKLNFEKGYEFLQRLHGFLFYQKSTFSLVVNIATSMVLHFLPHLLLYIPFTQNAF